MEFRGRWEYLISENLEIDIRSRGLFQLENRIIFKVWEFAGAGLSGLLRNGWTKKKEK
ncbi:MAG: hypothetical protein JW984_14755 [Deltaproteobacteria bacterium]|uniref:Uncharacterized protein n=1 Tax=Candidatus Zymogenus saltonus TaxID=2844893 RepID=A0A9D8KII4_9DELT|nr:hypothetical protein [Candidatus Zymogenus saltonus]